MATILIVDDEVGILNICKRTLELKKFKIFTVNNGTQALEIINNNTIDLVLLDLRMPNIDGIEILKKIRKTSPNLEVIIITAETSMEVAVETLKIGAFDYIIKPFNVIELIASVQKALEFSKLRHQQSIFRETTSLYKFYYEMDETSNPDELLRLIMESAIKAFCADSGSIFIYNPSKEILQLKLNTGKELDKKVELKMGDRIAGLVAQKQEPLLIKGPLKKEAAEFKNLEPNQNISSSMIVPLIKHDLLVGVICLNRLVVSKTPHFTSSELESLNIFSTHAAVILSIEIEELF